MSNPDLIDVGEIVRVTNGEGFKTKPAGTLFDPSDVVLSVRAPDGTVSDYTGGELDHDSTGLWHYDLTADQEGRWHYRWDGDAVINQDYFYVRPNNVERGDESS